MWIRESGTSFRQICFSCINLPETAVEEIAMAILAKLADQKNSKYRELGQSFIITEKLGLSPLLGAT